MEVLRVRRARKLSPFAYRRILPSIKTRLLPMVLSMASARHKQGLTQRTQHKALPP